MTGDGRKVGYIRKVLSVVLQHVARAWYKKRS